MQRISKYEIEAYLRRLKEPPAPLDWLVLLFVGLFVFMVVTTFIGG